MDTSDDDRLAALLKRTQHALDVHLDRSLQAIGLTRAQYSALATLDAQTRLSNAELARRCHVTAQTMHRVVGLLERAGQVGRRSHPAHGRIQEIAITRRGRSSVAKARKLVASVEDEVFAGASDRDVKVVRRVLRNALEAIEAA